jgi:transposase
LLPPDAPYGIAPEFRIIRLHTRRRRDLTDERSREKQRAEKLLEDAALKLSSVLTDLHGVTGRDIMDRLIAGQRDPKTLAGCARTRARAKIPQLREALEGAEFFTAHHARLLRSILSRMDAITAETGELSAVIEELLAPYEEQLQQAGSMPGWGRRAAQDVIAETGTGMTRFPCAVPKLCAWLDLLVTLGACAHPTRLPIHSPRVRLACPPGGQRHGQRRGDLGSSP